MSEIIGLKVSIDPNCPEGTAHLVTPPPARDDFRDDAAYDEAYRVWTLSIATIRGIGSVAGRS